MKKVISYFILYLCMLPLPGFAQKVGLVLSGGGAKGLAHIGVIRALEENNIPIDYITGTSMGAIIGGLYASGYSPDEMETLFKSEDFKLWFKGIIPPEYVYYFKKLDENPSFIDLDFARNEDKIKLALPTNIIPPGQIDFAFMELFSPANAVAENNFDQLFVPFRCVATDIYLNKPVVFSKGDLGLAVRASMTVPFVFKPIEIDSVLLFDGGLINNFPYDVLHQDFKPDIMIGSAIEFKNKKPKKDDLKLQIWNMMVRKTSYSIPDSLGITIKPIVDNFAFLDFEKFDEIENVGYEAALAQIESIKSRIARRADLDLLTRRREEYRSKSPTMIFNNIQVSGVDGSQRYYVIQSIRHKSKTFDLEELRREYFKILADDKIKSLLPTADYNKNTGFFDLQLKAEQQKPLEVGVGGYFSLSDINQGYIGLDYRLFNNLPITLQTNIHVGKFYSSFMVGSRFNFTTKQPFSLDLYFIKNRFNYFSGSTELFFEDKRPHYVVRNDDNIQLDISFPAKTTSKWEAGINFVNQSNDYYQTINYTKNDEPDQTTFTAGNLHARFEEKAFNKKQYPTEGKMFKFEAAYIFGTEKEEPGSTSSNNPDFRKEHQYFQVELGYERYFKSSKWLILGIETDSYFSSKKLFNNYTSSIIAAKDFSPTVNSTIRYLPYLRANNYVAGGLKAIVPISPSAHIRFEGYYFQPFQELLRKDNNQPYYSDQLFTSNQFVGSGGIVIHTPFGPASLLLNYFSNSDPRFYVQASFGYLLFNRHEN
ncbi:MAG TPA: patatin-like phospholipase family protein [Prolixibacteraceae bacterium]|nr:patatin-like phospholipase family protein [Prolixibacteraceae bacterium]